MLKFLIIIDKMAYKFFIFKIWKDKIKNKVSNTFIEFLFVNYIFLDNFFIVINITYIAFIKRRVDWLVHWKIN